MEQSQKLPSTPSKSALSKSENRTISNLDKYIEVVASNIKKKNEKNSDQSLLDRISVADSGRKESKRSGGVDLVSETFNIRFNN